MAQHERLAHVEIPDAALEIIGEVRAADAAGGEAQAHLVVSERTLINLLDPQILGGMKHGGAHDHSRCEARIRGPLFCYR